MNTRSFNRYFSALVSQQKYEQVIETFQKMDSLKVPKSEAIYANTMAAFAQRGDL